MTTFSDEPDFDYEMLDPGVRDMVRWLRKKGYETIDSGDGVSKPAETRTISRRHVVIRLPKAHRAVFVADNLARRIRMMNHPVAVVEVSYKTDDCIALLVLYPDGDQ